MYHVFIDLKKKTLTGFLEKHFAGHIGDRKSISLGCVLQVVSLSSLKQMSGFIRGPRLNTSVPVFTGGGTREARQGGNSKLVYADNQVLTGKRIEEAGQMLLKWKLAMESKELKINMEK